MVVAVALGAAACGGSGDGPDGLSTAQLIVRGDRACSETQDDFEDIEANRPSTRGEAVRKARRLIEESGDQVEALQLLRDDAPERLTGDLNRYIASLETSRQNLQEAKAAAIRGSPAGYNEARRDYGRGQAESLARAVGFTECGLPHAGPTGTTGPQGPTGTTGPRGPTRRACASGYSQCLDPDALDYDCIDNEGDGPKYVQGPIRVTGSDPFDLDREGDGVGCE